MAKYKEEQSCPIPRMRYFVRMPKKDHCEGQEAVHHLNDFDHCACVWHNRPMYVDMCSYG